MKTVLLTGAFGNIGCYVLTELLKQGYRVRAFDLDNKINREQSQQFSQGESLSIAWGDIRDEDGLNSLVSGVDAVIHLACIIPPTTEDLPELTQAINVEATKTLIAICEAQEVPPQLLYASSFTVIAMPDDKALFHTERTVHDPLKATDNYTRQKIACEAALQASSLNFMIGRIAVAIDENLRLADKRLVVAMMKVHAQNPMEYVHPQDIALAFVNAIDNVQARRKIFLLGGGKSCQVKQIDLIEGLLGAAGMRFKPSDLGQEPYYTHWLDTAESQAALQFQTTSFADFKQAAEKKLKWTRCFVSPIAPLAKLGFKLWLKI